MSGLPLLAIRRTVQSTAFGIDPARTRSGAANLIVYNDYLYIGEYNDEEIALERILVQQVQHRRGRQERHGRR